MHRAQEIYLSELANIQTAEKRIRLEFAQQLDTKDRAIADYQEQVTVLKEEKKNLSIEENETYDKTVQTTKHKIKWSNIFKN